MSQGRVSTEKPEWEVRGEGLRRGMSSQTDVKPVAAVRPED